MAWRRLGGGHWRPIRPARRERTWAITGNWLASKTYPSREAFLSDVIVPVVARMSVGLKPVIREIHADAAR